jgi:hypothetical protein
MNDEPFLGKLVSPDSFFVNWNGDMGLSSVWPIKDRSTGKFRNDYEICGWFSRKETAIIIEIKEPVEDESIGCKVLILNHDKPKTGWVSVHTLKILT